MPRRRFSNGAVDILKDIIETLDTESTTLEQSSPQVPIQHTLAQSNQPSVHNLTPGTKSAQKKPFSR